jgi:hypothetical protein
MLELWILVALTHPAGPPAFHTFYTEKACIEARDRLRIGSGVRRKYYYERIFCVKDKN